MCLAGHIAQKMKLSIKYFFSKCDHILSKVQILLKKSLMGNFIFVQSQFLNSNIHEHLPIGVFKHNWKSQELDSEKFAKYGVPQQLIS